MSDTERLQQMAQSAEASRIRQRGEAEQLEERKKQQEVDRIASAKTKNEELLKYCEETFKGFKLHPSGHEVMVKSTPGSDLHNLRKDGIDYTAVFISHWDDSGPTYTLPLVLCRFAGGMYQVAVGMSGIQQHAPNFELFKEFLLRVVAETGLEDVAAMIREMKSRRR